MRCVLALLLAATATGQSLENSIRSRIAGFDGEVSLYAKNLDSGATIGIKESERVRTASTIKLPIDSVAQISTEGLLGGSYIALVPGGDDKVIPPGGEIKYTQPGINVVQLLGKFIFDGASQATEPKTEPKK